MKKLLSSIFAFVLLISIALPIKTEAAQVFSDVPKSHSNYADISYLLDEGIISKASKYGVSDIVTREEVAVMISKAVGLDGTQRDTKFKDVPSTNKNSGYIQSAVDAGIITGYTDGTFRPTAKVTRGHMAAFIARAFDLPSGTKTFKDVPTTHTAYSAVKELAAANITTGYPDGTFKPSGNLSRAHISAFLARAVLYKETGSAKFKEMKVHFINVGQGDSILIQSPNGKTMLIDGGAKATGNTLVSYIKSLGIKKLDYVVATHPDADHIGGLISVLNSISIGEFINSGKEHTTETYEQMLKLVLDKKIKYTEPKTGDFISLDKDLKVQVLHADASASDTNDASIVLKVTYNEVPVLLTGDADINIESQIISKYDASAAILKAGHHGSNTSSSLSFLQKVKPSATILSYGKDNSYGHPHKEVMSNLKTIGSKAYSTAVSGTIIATVNPYAFSMSAKEFTITTPTPVPPKPKPEPTPTPTPKPEPPKPQPPDLSSGIYVIPGAPTTFKNCDAMRGYYPYGVKSSHPAYASKHDRDKDGWACEK